MRPLRFLARFLVSPRAALLDAAEWSPDRSQRATWGDRYTIAAEDVAIPQDERLRAISECRDLLRNSAVTRGIVERVRGITVGVSGILPEATTEDAAWNDAAEKLWAAWCHDPEGTGQSDMAELQGLLAASTLTDGGMALLLHDDGTVTPIETDRLLADPNGEPGSLPFRVDARGRVTAWCVHDRRRQGQFDPPKYRWVSAKRILTLFVRVRADQVLPLPQLTACALTVRDMEELNRYTLRQAKVQSITAAIHTRGASGAPAFQLRGREDAADAEAAGAKRFEKATGMTVIDTDGDYRTLAPSTPSSTYDTFMRHNLRLVSMAVGLPYEFLALYFADGTYSSAKATMTQAREAVALRQRHLKRAILQPLWEWQTSRWVALGLLPPPPGGVASVRWRDPAFEWMDIKDSVQTDLMEVRAGLRTMEDLAAKRGGDYPTLLRKRAQEVLLLREVADETGIPAEELSAIVLPGATPAAGGQGTTVSDGEPQEDRRESRDAQEAR